MTVEELIKQLDEMPKDAIVIAEGKEIDDMFYDIFKGKGYVSLYKSKGVTKRGCVDEMQCL